MAKMVMVIVMVVDVGTKDVSGEDDEYKEMKMLHNNGLLKESYNTTTNTSSSRSSHKKK